MEYPNMSQRSVPSPEPPERKRVSRLNDYTEVSIGGVVYRVRSVFSDKGQLGDLLNLAAVEKLSRIA